MQAIKHNKYKLLFALFFSIISTPAALITLIDITGGDSPLNSSTFGYITLVIIFAILFFVYFELILAYIHLLKKTKSIVLVCACNRNFIFYFPYIY
jgi:hypothetical protein